MYKYFYKQSVLLIKAKNNLIHKWKVVNCKSRTLVQLQKLFSYIYI